MARRHWGQHEQGCYPCKLASVSISPAATPTRLNPHIAPRGSTYNSYEKGEPRDHRGMPYLDTRLNPLTQKEWDRWGRRANEDLERRRAYQAAAASAKE